MDKVISEEDKEIFNLLRMGFKADRMCLMLCPDIETGEEVVVICGLYGGGLGEDIYKPLPFGRLFEGNPYTQVGEPIDREGAYYSPNHEVDAYLTEKEVKR